jgi:hypothetical protein
LSIACTVFPSPPRLWLTSKYKDWHFVFLTIRNLYSVSSVLDSWLVLVSTIPKPPNTLILWPALAPPPGRTPLCRRSAVETRSVTERPNIPHKMSDMDREWKPKVRPQSFVSLYRHQISK